MAPDGSRALARLAQPRLLRGAVAAWLAVPGRREALAVAWRATWVSRLLVWTTGVASSAIWGLMGRHAAFDPAGLTTPYGALGDHLAAPFARWDSVWYLAVANGGYGDDRAKAAFFPLYPLLVHVTGTVTGSALWGGVLVSLVSLVAGLAVVHRLTALELGPVAAGRAVWLAALFPMSFFYNAVYAEALFLALSAGAVYAARTGRWPWAGVLGALAAGTRSTGVLLVVPLALLAVRGRRRPPLAALWTLLVPAGLLVFCGWLAWRGPGAGAPFDAQEVWFRAWAGPLGGIRDGAVAAWDGARQLLSGSRTPVYFTKAGGDPFNVAWHNIMLFAFLPPAIVACAGALRRLPLAYGAYAVAALAVPLSYPVGPQPLMSLPRFMLVVFPLFMWAGGAVGRRGFAVACVVSAGGLVAFGAQFATWHWVA